MSPLLSGALVMACFVVGLHFLRFWKSTRDALFFCFALSFWIQGAQWLHSALLNSPSEYSPLYYLARLLAYSLIAAPILLRNRQRSQP